MNSGEIDRLMKTASLFLATCNLIENYTDMKLPFTYKDFFKIACNKIKFQVELISKTDKLASFFKAMDVMIDSKAIKEGRDFAIDTPERFTIKLPGGEKRKYLFLQELAYCFYVSAPFIRNTLDHRTTRKIRLNLPSSRTYVRIPVTLDWCMPAALIGMM